MLGRNNLGVCNSSCLHFMNTPFLQEGGRLECEVTQIQLRKLRQQSRDVTSTGILQMNQLQLLMDIVKNSFTGLSFLCKYIVL